MIRRHRPRRSAFTLIEVLVVIGIMAVLMSILLPVVEIMRHKGYITKCSSNLRTIGQGLAMYTNENRGNYPRTMYVPGVPPVYGTHPDTVDPFTAGGPDANDVTAALFLLVRQGLPAEVFICPYNDDTEFAIDTKATRDRSNFTDYRRNLAYSFANPYPPAGTTGYFFKSNMSAGFALAADLNPGVKLPASDVTAPVANSPSATMKKALSRNHERDGQNVLYADGHVSWEKTPFCGVNNDNIFTNRAGAIEAAPQDRDDSVLLPVD